MNDLQIFNYSEFSRIKETETMIDGSFLGIFYALEWDDMLKLGQSSHPYTRIMAHKRNAENYGNVRLGRVAISCAHTNYRENELKLHTYFANQRVAGTEIFDISMDEFIESLSIVGLEYKDESEGIDKRSQIVLEGLQHLLLGDQMNPTTVQNQNGAFSSELSAPLAAAALEKTMDALALAEQLLAERLVKQRSLTADDYIRAATIVAGCSDERLPYVLAILKQCGFSLAPENRGW